VADKLIEKFLGLITNKDDIVQIVEQSNKAHLINIAAILMMLVDKKIIEPEDIGKYKMLATHQIDQEWTRRRDKDAEKTKEIMDKLDDIWPGFTKTFENKGLE
jgi:hypothetical protein